MTRETLERRQVWIYLAAVLAGISVGTAAPDVARLGEALLWPCLVLLLYSTFTQIPLARLAVAFRDIRFIAAASFGNFLVLPLFVWLLLGLLPDDPAIRLGVLLVLLAPCTDWFITFTHQAGGDARRAIAITPAMLLGQIVLLPLYLWLFMEERLVALVPAGRMATVFLLVIVLPLLLAWLTQRRAARSRTAGLMIDRFAWLPVPLLAFVLFLVAASQVEAVRDAIPLFGQVFFVFALFLAGAAVCGVVLARLFRQKVAQARTLLFSFATRNSFVVLPLALALPASWETAAIVIVFQSLIELFGVLVLLWLVPRRLMPG